MGQTNSPAKARKQREYQERRADILDTAEAVFAERGYVATTMEQIAHEAGFSVGSLYKYFKNKEDMYAEMLRAKVIEAEPRVNEAIAQGKDPLDKLQRYFSSRIDLYWENPKFFSIFFHQAMGPPFNASTGLTPEVQDRYDYHLKTIEAIYADGIKQGLFRDIAPQTLVSISEGVIRSYTAQLTQQNAQIRNTTEERALFQLFTTGLIVTP